MIIPDKPDLNTLCHFGVKGMKWGIINEDNPANPNVKSDDKHSRKLPKSFSDYETVNRKELKNEKKASRFVDRANEYKSAQLDLDRNGPKSETFKKSYGMSANLPDSAFNKLFGKSKDAAAKDLSLTSRSLQLKNEKAASDKRAGKLTDDQKLAIASALVVVMTAATAYGIYRYRKSIKGGLSMDDILENDPHIKSFLSATKDRNFKFEDLPDTDMTIGVGDNLKRICGAKEDHVKDTFYAAWRDQDVQRYLGVYAPNQATFNTGEKDLYSNTLKAVKEIKIPSQKNMLEAYVKFCESQTLQERANFWRGFNDTSSTDAMETYLRFEGAKHAIMNNREYAESTFEGFVSSLVRQHDGIQTSASRYFSTLQEKGYDGMIDVADKGRLGDLPLFIFNGKNNFELSDRTKITPEIVKKAQSSIRFLDS